MVAYKGFGRINASQSTHAPPNTASVGEAVRQPSISPPEPTPRNRSPVSKMDQIKRHSFPVLPSKLKDKEKDKEKDNRKRSQSPAVKPAKPTNKLDMFTESPPNIFFKGPQESSGALFSAQMLMTIVDPEITLESFDMKLNVVVTTKKPVVKDCPDCLVKTTQLHQWTFIKEPKRLSAGEHRFPFSYLFPGHLPATTEGHIGILKYYLEAKAKTKSTTVTGGGDGAERTITLRRELPLLRAKEELQDRGHTRLFPPTNLAAYVTFPPVIHPIGDFAVNMRINGCNDLKDEAKGVVYRWRLRKMNWKLEEKESMVSPACSKHSNKIGGEGKGIQHEETRSVGRGDASSGWKTDLSAGEIEMEFSCRPFAGQRPLCDVDSPNGLKIVHQLVVELVISEEWAKIKNPENICPTGAARVLRMTFPLDITERAGLGVSWDEETPPVYEDVPASPPVYPQKEMGFNTPQAAEATRSGGEMLEYTGPPLTPPPAIDAELEGLRLGEPSNITLNATAAAPSAMASSSHQGASDASSGPWTSRGRTVLNIEDFHTD